MIVDKNMDLTRYGTGICEVIWVSKDELSKASHSLEDNEILIIDEIPPLMSDELRHELNLLKRISAEVPPHVETCVKRPWYRQGDKW